MGNGLVRGQRGQITPVLVVALVAILAVGVMLFQVGRAALLRADAQTAADAAALAAAREMGRQLSGLDASAAGIDEGAMRAAAADYAQRNGSELVSFERDLFDVRVTVRTQDALDGEAEDIDAEGERGTARAQAQLEPALGGLGGGVPTGNISGSIKDAILLGQSMGLTLTSFLRPGDTDSLHSKGIAADLAGSPAQMAAFYRAALRRYKYIEELFYDPLGGIDKNVQIGPIGGHLDHVHIALIGDQVKAPGAGKDDAPQGADDLAATPVVSSGADEVRLVPYED